MPFTAPSGPTTGLQRFDLSDSQVRTRDSLAREMLGRVRSKKRPAAAKPKHFATDVVMRANINQPEEAMKMDTNEVEKLFGALHKSVTSIAASAEANKDELIADSLGKFETALAEQMGEALNNAYDAGVQGNFRAFAGDDESLAKGMNEVAEMAAVLRQAEFLVDGIAARVESGAHTVSPISAAAITDWIAVGGQVLKLMITEATGVSHDEPDGDEGEGEMFADDTVAGEAAEKMADTVLRLRKAVETINGHLAKGEQGQAPEQGEQGEEQAEMNPIEVIGRLAAAILVQCENLLGEMGGEEQAADQGQQAPQQGQQPPQFAQKSDEAPEGEDGLKKGEEEEVKEEATEAPAAEAAADENLGKAAPAVSAEVLALIEQNKALMAKLDTQGKEIDSLKKAAPAPAKRPTLTVVDKAGESSLSKSDDDKALAERLSKMSEDDRAAALIKIARQNGGVAVG